MDTAGQKPNTLNPDLVRQALPPGGGTLKFVFRPKHCFQFNHVSITFKAASFELPIS